MQIQAVHPPFLTQTSQPLIKYTDIEQALPQMAPKAVKPFLSKLAMDLLKLNEINKIYAKYESLSGLDFIDGVLNELQINLEIQPDMMNMLPKKGAFVLVSNHPLGLLDGLILAKIMLAYNPNTKLLANFLLKKIERLSTHIIPVNPYESGTGSGLNTGALKQVISHVKQGHPLIVFPSGEVSDQHKGWSAEVCDSDWKTSIARLITKLNVPIVPVYLHGKNSSLFYVMARLNPMLKSAAIPGEFIRSRGKSIGISIGHAIHKEQIDACKNPVELALFLKLRTYFLQNCIAVEKQKEPHLGQKIEACHHFQKEVEIEINLLISGGASLVATERYEVVFTRLKSSSAILHSLSILREATFRAVGEGTQNTTDTDSFDSYYHHLILWDKESNTIAGSYRLGVGREILQQSGINGFYTQQLFHYAPEMSAILHRAVEIGRSFVTKEYQQRPLPLLLLWKGIMAAVQHVGNIDYIFGAASISNQYSVYSKTLMIDFLKNHHCNSEIAQMVRPKVKFIPTYPKSGKELIAYYQKDDLPLYELLIKELEHGSRGFPILIKKYLSLHAQYVCCSVDPGFSSCLDVLLFIRVAPLIDHPMLLRR